MGIRLPRNLYTALLLQRCKYAHRHCIFISILFTIISLFTVHAVKAQVIVETFEEMSASTRFATSSATCSYAVTSSSATIEITGTISFTTSSTASATSSNNGNGANASKSTFCTSSTITSSTTDWDTNTSSTLGPDSTGTFSWYYGASGNGSRISICSESTSSGFHSTDFYAEIPTTSLIISPIVPQGISTVSFWVYGGASGKIVVGLRTTQTTAANSFSTYPSKSAQANTIFTNLTIHIQRLWDPHSQRYVIPALLHLLYPESPLLPVQRVRLQELKTSSRLFILYQPPCKVHLHK
jgi:hypothetical protein